MQYNAFTHQGKKNNAVREGGYMDYWTLVNLDWENLILMGARGVCVELYAFRLNCFFFRQGARVGGFKGGGGCVDFGRKGFRVLFYLRKIE